MAIKDWSTTAATNTTVGGISIAEGMAPGNVNNAMREIMAQIASGFGAIINVKDYGAAGDDATDDTVAVQAAITAAGALTPKAGVYFPAGVYGISSSLTMLADVRLYGEGTIARLDRAAPGAGSNAFDLVWCADVDGWEIDGLTFENVTMDLKVSETLATSVTAEPGRVGACVSAVRCSRWAIRNCTFRKFTTGVRYTYCDTFAIHGNYFNGDTSKTVADLLAGTYGAEFVGYQGTGGIVASFAQSGAGNNPLPSSHFVIADNVIEVPGLDVAIEASSQVFEQQPGIVHGNVIRGCRVGVRAYSGSFADLGTATTYNVALIIANNHIYATHNQGIYIRGTVGVQCIGNYVERAALVGTCPAGANHASILTRINPWDSTNVATFTAAASLSDQHHTLIANNRIVNQGLDGAEACSWLQIRTSNCRVTGNTIVKAGEAYTAGAATSYAIQIDGGGEEINAYEVIDNAVIGEFAVGIYCAGASISATAANTHKPRVIAGNSIDGASVGIDLIPALVGLVVRNNVVSNAATACYRLKGMPLSLVSGNQGRNSPIMFSLLTGLLAGDVPFYLSAGTITAAIRRGGSLTVTGNVAIDVDAFYTIGETSAADGTISGRILYESGNIHNGYPVVNATANATPVSAATCKTWNVGDEQLATNPSAGNPYKSVCVTPGTYGAATATTGDTTNTSASITNVASLDGIGPGIWVTIDGVLRRVLEVDVAGSFVVDTAMTATDTGVAIAPATPTFVSVSLP